MNILNMPPGLDFGLLAQAGPSVLDAVLKSLLLLALAALVTGATYLGRKWPHLARPGDERRGR